MSGSSRAAGRAILHIPRSSGIYKFGVADKASLACHDSLTMNHGENWAVLGPAKTTLIEAFAGKHRITPPPPNGIFPFLSAFDPPKDPHSSVRLVSFAYRRQLAAGGGFYDYSARYGAVREEDRVTLRESILADAGDDGDVELLLRLSKDLELHDKLDLPLVALSNGQTRRASVLRQLLLKPDVLLLDEPLTGLDVKQRPLLLRLLHELHQRRSPLIILGLRQHDPIPDWVTNVAIAKEEGLLAGTKQELNEAILASAAEYAAVRCAPSGSVKPKDAQKLIEIKGLKIAYQDRQILDQIDWTIREGDRWQLSGPNGSGKTTLLSVITGDHPQSYIQPHLVLFGQPRRRLATAQIQSQIGLVSPEIFNAFPRRSGARAALSARDAIGTGFESTFSYRPRTKEQDEEVNALLEYFAPVLAQPQPHSPGAPETFNADQPFGGLPIGHQALILLLRCFVGSPRLLILDEVFAGMDDRMVSLAKKYLREELKPTQAVVFVSHWEEEIPWGGDELQRMHLG